MSYIFATESDAKNISLITNLNTTDKLLCTKTRAETLGCIVNETYEDNQFVKLKDLSPDNNLWFEYFYISSVSLITNGISLTILEEPYFNEDELDVTRWTTTFGSYSILNTTINNSTSGVSNCIIEINVYDSNGTVLLTISSYPTSISFSGPDHTATLNSVNYTNLSSSAAYVSLNSITPIWTTSTTSQGKTGYFSGILLNTNLVEIPTLSSLVYSFRIFPNPYIQEEGATKRLYIISSTSSTGTLEGTSITNNTKTLSEDLYLLVSPGQYGVINTTSPKGWNLTLATNLVNNTTYNIIYCDIDELQTNNSVFNIEGKLLGTWKILDSFIFLTSKYVYLIDKHYMTLED